MRQIIPFSKEIVFKTNIASITSISLEHEEKVFDGEISGDFIIFGDYKVHNDTTEKELFKYRLPFTTLIPDTVIKESVVVDVTDFTYEQIESDVLKVDIQFSVDGEEVEESPATVSEENDSTMVEELPKEEIEEDVVRSSVLLEPEVKEEESLIEEDNRKYEEELDQFLEQLDTPEEVKIEETEKIEESPVVPMVVEKENQEDEKKPEREHQVEEMVPSKNQEESKQVEEYVTYHIHIVKAEETLESIVRNYGVSLEFVQEYNDVTNIQIGDKIIIPDVVDE